MFGAAKAGFASKNIHVVTEGSAVISSDTWYGTNTSGSSFGSISPDKLLGVSIADCFYIDDNLGVDAFVFRIAGIDRGQSFFASINPEGGETFLTANASYNAGNAPFPYTGWIWSGVTIPAAWDGTGTVQVVIL